jgi:hypothetical protein
MLKNWKRSSFAIILLLTVTTTLSGCGNKSLSGTTWYGISENDVAESYEIETLSFAEENVVDNEGESYGYSIDDDLVIIETKQENFTYKRSEVEGKEALVFQGTSSSNLNLIYYRNKADVQDVIDKYVAEAKKKAEEEEIAEQKKIEKDNEDALMLLQGDYIVNNGYSDYLSNASTISIKENKFTFRFAETIQIKSPNIIMLDGGDFKNFIELPFDEDVSCDFSIDAHKSETQDGSNWYYFGTLILDNGYSERFELRDGSNYGNQHGFEDGKIYFSIDNTTRWERMK